MEFKKRISVIQSHLSEGETFVDLLETKAGYIITAGDNDYYHNIALTPQHFEQLVDAIAEVLVPGITETLNIKQMEDIADAEDLLKITNPAGVEVTFASIPPVLSVSSLDESEDSSFK